MDKTIIQTTDLVFLERGYNFLKYYSIFPCYVFNWILVYISQMIVYVIIMCKFFGFICRVGDGTIHRVNRFSGGILLCGMILIALYCSGGNMCGTISCSNTKT